MSVYSSLATKMVAINWVIGCLANPLILTLQVIQHIWSYVKKRVLLKNWVKTHFVVKCSRKVLETCRCHQNIGNSILYNPDVLYFCSKMLSSRVNWSICVLPLLRILPFLSKKALKRLRLLWSFFAPQLFEYFLYEKQPKLQKQPKNCKNSPKL